MLQVTLIVSFEATCGLIVQHDHFVVIYILLWNALDMNNFYFLFLLFSDFIGILFSFSFSFLLDDEEAHDKEVT